MKPNDPLREALRRVRSEAEPSPDLEARLLRALAHAEEQEQTDQRGLKRRSIWFSHLRLSLPALASVAIAAHLALVEPTGHEEAIVEHRVELPDEGHAALPLSLSLHHHDAEFAAVRMDLPHGIKVSPTSQVVHTSEPNCHSAGCIYEFLHPTTGKAPLEVHVEKPGKYRVEVEHASDSKRLREIIVVHASR